MLFTPMFGADHCLFPANSLEHFTCSKWPATLQFPAYNGRPQPFMTGAGWPCLLLPCMGLATVFSCHQFGCGHGLFTLLPSPFLILNGRPLCSFQHTMAGHNHFLTGVGWPCILLPCMGLATALLYIYGSGHPPLIYHISVPFPYTLVNSRP
jgi:hypothetical protein